MMASPNVKAMPMCPSAPFDCAFDTTAPVPAKTSTKAPTASAPVALIMFAVSSLSLSLAVRLISPSSTPGFRMGTYYHTAQAGARIVLYFVRPIGG
jgi:hypothetical protein